MIGPTPKISVTVVADAATAAVMRSFESAADAVEIVDLIDELDRQAVPFDRRYIAGLDAIEK